MERVFTEINFEYMVTDVSILLPVPKVSRSFVVTFLSPLSTDLPIVLLALSVLLKSVFGFSSVMYSFTLQGATPGFDFSRRFPSGAVEDTRKAIRHFLLFREFYFTLLNEKDDVRVMG